MVGTRNVAFPRLNAFSYWIYLFGGLMLFVAFAAQHRPGRRLVRLRAARRARLLARQARRRLGADDHLHRVSGLLEAVILITTIFKLRAPGMTLNRIPLFVWAMLVTAFMVIFAMPAVMLASTALILDRLVGTHFFNPAEGGDALLWQHLFWFFGHPEVYIIFIPALGIVSSIIATFARRPIFGYPAMVLSLIATAFLGFGLWVHHMFATGLPRARQELLHRRQHDDRDPDRRCRSSAGSRRCGPAGSSFARRCCSCSVLRHLRHRRPDRRDARLGAARPAGARHLLRRRPPPLRADRRRGVPAVRRLLLLVPEDHRPDAERAARPLELLAVLRRLQRHVLPDAPARAARHAAAGLHLSGGDGLGHAERCRDARRAD